MLRTQDLPIWVTIFAILVFIFSSITGMVVLFGLQEEMDPLINKSWAGRHFGLGLALGLAVLLKSPSAYLVALMGGVVRDFGDLLAELNQDSLSGSINGILLFLILGILAVIETIKARSRRNEGGN